MKQQHICPAIIIVCVFCVIGIVIFPQISGYFPLAFVPVFLGLGIKRFSVSDDLLTHVEKHFPEFYKKHRLFNTVPYLGMMKDKEVLEQLDDTVLKMQKEVRFYTSATALTFVLIIVVGVVSVAIKWEV